MSQQTQPTVEKRIITQQFTLNDYSERNQIMTCMGCTRYFNPRTLDDAVAIASRHEEKYHTEAHH